MTGRLPPDRAKTGYEVATRAGRVRRVAPMTTTDVNVGAPPSIAARAEGATKIYRTGDTEVRALDGVDVDFETSR